MLDVRRMRVLREVALRGSFSAAAEALSFTQSAVSQQIAALEREAGAVQALRARPEVDPDRIVLAGASVGGSTVAYVLGTQPGLPVRGGVGFSAVEGPREVALSKRRAFRPHDLLLISDHREARSARNLRADAHGKGITIFFAETTGHGIALLSDASVRARAIGWLERLTA